MRSCCTAIVARHGICDVQKRSVMIPTKHQSKGLWTDDTFARRSVIGGTRSQGGVEGPLQHEHNGVSGATLISSSTTICILPNNRLLLTLCNLFLGASFSEMELVKSASPHSIGF